MTRAEALKKAREAKSGGVSTIQASSLKTFTRKAKTEVSELDKMWHFQLCVEYPINWFPVDKKTGKLNKAPYPKHYVIPNEGIAWDEKTGRARKWRYIEGQESIWVDEQPLLEGLSEGEVAKLLAENQIEFEYGQLHVPGIKTLLLQALQVQDSFEGKERQYRPKNREYRLLNPQKQAEDEMALMDRQYAAEKLARECDTDKMLECAFVMGFDISDLSDAGIARTRLEFLKKAKYDPNNPKGIDWFMDIVNDPTTHVKYVVSEAFSQGIISANQQPNRLTWAAPNTPIMEVASNGNVIDQIVEKWVIKDELTLKLIDELENQIYSSIE